MAEWKSDPARPLPVRVPPQPRRWAPCWGLALLVTALLALYRTTRSAAPTPASGTPGPFNWEQINPSESLQYHDCGDGFQCARLQVPMDYNRTHGPDRKFALALVRVPAKVPVGDPRYGGAVLINPGTLVLHRLEFGTC